jgi:hypothetical protein
LRLFRVHNPPRESVSLRSLPPPTVWCCAYAHSARGWMQVEHHRRKHVWLSGSPQKAGAVRQSRREGRSDLYTIPCILHTVLFLSDFPTWTQGDTIGLLLELPVAATSGAGGGGRADESQEMSTGILTVCIYTECDWCARLVYATSSPSCRVVCGAYANALFCVAQVLSPCIRTVCDSVCCVMGWAHRRRSTAAGEYSIPEYSSLAYSRPAFEQSVQRCAFARCAQRPAFSLHVDTPPCKILSVY